MIHLSFTILTAPCILWSLFLLLFFYKGFNFEMKIQIPFFCQVASLDVNPRDLALLVAMVRWDLILVFCASGCHIFLGVFSVCLGVILSIQAEVWLAHSVSPIWSGGIVSLTYVCLVSEY